MSSRTTLQQLIRAVTSSHPHGHLHERTLTQSHTHSQTQTDRHSLTHSHLRTCPADRLVCTNECLRPPLVQRVSPTSIPALPRTVMRTPATPSFSLMASIQTLPSYFFSFLSSFIVLFNYRVGCYFCIMKRVPCSRKLQK